MTGPPSEPITLEWMKTRLSNIKDDLVTNQTQKSQVDKYIAESKVNNGVLGPLSDIIIAGFIAAANDSTLTTSDF